MNTELRPYQERAIDRVKESYSKGNKRALIVLPTGLGKTCCMAAIAENEVNNGGKVLFLAHRNTLLKQGAEEIENMTGIKTGYISGDERPDSSIVIASIQAMSRGERLHSFDKDEYSLIMIDEAHHILAKTYKSVVEYFDDAKLLGVTATPKRGDKEDISDEFDEVASEYTIMEAIKDGWLSPISVQTCPLKINVDNIHIQTGDYASGDIGEALLPYMDKIADEIMEKAADRKVLIFVPLVATARGLADIFQKKGALADYVAGERRNSPEIMDSFKRGEINILINAMLLTEGYNEPSVDCIVNLRITKSETLLTQMVGRGTRKAPGKNDLLILDFFWNSKREKRILSVANLISATDLDVEERDMEEVIRRCKKNISDKPVNLADLMNSYGKSVQKEREEALLRALKREEERQKRIEERRIARELYEQRVKNICKTEIEKRSQSLDKYIAIVKKISNPLNSVFRSDIEDLVKMTWETPYTHASVSDHRLKDGTVHIKGSRFNDFDFLYSDNPVLKALGLSRFNLNRCNMSWAFDECSEIQASCMKENNLSIKTKGFAGYIIGNLKKRRERGLCSYKQAKVLCRNGVKDCSNITFATASKAIDELSKNRWIPTARFRSIISEEQNGKKDNEEDLPFF